jgi:CheY-like chemotaxis protein
MTTLNLTSLPPQPVTSPKKRVLLVDASPTMRDLRAEVMRKRGIEVDCASDISEARSWWRADLYNLVLINVGNELGHRDRFCEDIRSATPPQQVAFLVGKPDYLVEAPDVEASSDQPDSDSAFRHEKSSSTRLPDLYAGEPQRWGILEASRQIHAVRSALQAHSKELRDRPSPPRDCEIRPTRQETQSRSLDDLLREEMQ